MSVTTPCIVQSETVMDVGMRVQKNDRNKMLYAGKGSDDDKEQYEGKEREGHSS